MFFLCGRDPRAIVFRMRKILIASLMGTTAALASLPEALEWKAPDGTVVHYRWHAPAKPEAGKTYPLVVFLHGAGERGDDNTAQLKHGVMPIIEGAEKLGEPCFLIAPQCPAGRWWSPIDEKTMRLSEAGKPNALLEAVLALVDRSIKEQAVDPRRVYVTGISMGGYATWDLLVRAHGKIAAAVPICGGGDPSLAAGYKDIPIRAFHGDADSVVPPRTTREMIEALETAGGTPQATFYPGVGHDSWTATYANPEVIRWMFDQKKP